MRCVGRAFKAYVKDIYIKSMQAGSRAKTRRIVKSTTARHPALWTALRFFDKARAADNSAR